MENLPGKPGRPSIYTKEIAEEICVRLALGESLKAICDSDHLPAVVTVMRWVLNDRDGFGPLYARAREMQAEYFADELTAIADDARNDWMERQVRGETEIVVDKEHIMRSALRVDTRKFIMSRILPDKYGDRQRIDVNVKTQILTEEEKLARIKQILGSGLERARLAAPVSEGTGGTDAAIDGADKMDGAQGASEASPGKPS